MFRQALRLFIDPLRIAETPIINVLRNFQNRLVSGRVIIWVSENVIRIFGLLEALLKHIKILKYLRYL